jgi:Tfp pilus assembly protein PilE
MIKLNQKGFSALEVALILVIVGIVAGTGYFVYHATNKSNDTLNQANLNTESAVKHKKKDAAKKPEAKTSTPSTTNSTTTQPTQ